MQNKKLHGYSYKTLSLIVLRQCSPFYASERIYGGERVEGRGVDVQEVHFSSVRQAEQRNNEEEHG